MHSNKKIIITDTYPTPLQQDFVTFLTYIEKSKIKLTRASNHLPRKNLREIYSLLEGNKPDVPSHGNQRDYPMIHLFFHLALDVKLIRKVGTKSGIVLTVQQEGLSSYKKLTRSEQYVTLVETFWMNLDWEELQFRQRGAPSNIDILFDYLNQFPAGTRLPLEQYDELERRLDRYEYFLYYFSYFGFWELEIDDSYQPDHYLKVKAKSIKTTPLFRKLVEPLLETWRPEPGNLNAMMDLLTIFSPTTIEEEEEEEEEEEYEERQSLFLLLKPLFAEDELNQTLTNTGENTFVAGNYLFKVRLHSDCWRTMQLSGYHTLLDLHNLIQKAFNFDDDHLYAFFMDGKRFGKAAYNSPMDPSGPHVDQASIGAIDLYEGKQFLYLFDFGDEWELYVDVLQIEEGQEDGAALILEKVGESPEQYSW